MIRSNRLFFLPVPLLILSCAGRLKSEDRMSLPPKDPPRAEARVLKNDIKGGLPSLKGLKIGVLVIFNLPDGYLIRAKSKINPPDFALKEVLNLQTDRVDWMNEALVTHCESCQGIEVAAPMQILPEETLLRLIDRVSLNQAPTESDWAEIARAWPEQDVIWLILGSEDYEQKRGPAREKGLISAWSESRVNVRSLLRDVRAKKLLHEAVSNGHDEDLIVYQTVSQPGSGEPVRASVVSFQTDDLRKWEPQGSAFDSPKYDDVYPYPPVPESPLIIQKTLLKLTESLAP